MSEVPRTAVDEGLHARSQAFELSLDLMCVGSIEGELLQVNPAWTRCLGWSAAELVGQPWLSLVHADDVEATIRAGAELADGVAVFDFENRYRHKNGSYRRLSWRSHPVLSQRQVFGVARDVTERHEELLRQRESERLQRMAGEKSRLGGWSLDLASNTTVWSDEVCAIHEVPCGFRPTKAQAIEFYTPESRPVIEDAVRRCAEEGTPFDVELEILTHHKRHLWVRAMGEAVRNDEGRIAQLQGAFQDVTARRKIEDSLRASEARLNDAQRIANLGSWEWDVVNDKLLWSDETFRLFGIPVAEFGYNYASFLSGVQTEDRVRVDQAVRDALEGRRP